MHTIKFWTEEYINSEESGNSKLKIYFIFYIFSGISLGITIGLHILLISVFDVDFLVWLLFLLTLLIGTMNWRPSISLSKGKLLNQVLTYLCIWLPLLMICVFTRDIFLDAWGHSYPMKLLLIEIRGINRDTMGVFPASGVFSAIIFMILGTISDKIKQKKQKAGPD